MFIIRPRSIYSTPSALAQDLGCRTRRWPTRRPLTIDYNRDFIMAVVPPQGVLNGTADYAQTFNFAQKHKLGQRQAIARAGIPTPSCAGHQAEAERLSGESFVIRPLRHSGGRDYRVSRDRFDFRDGQEYVSELFPKRREYRVIFVFGQPLIWMRKKPDEGVTREAPWGHANSKFQTIHDTRGSRLGATDCVPRLMDFAPVRGAHICAADILYSSRVPGFYSVLELNFCPGLEIDNNRQKVVEAIRSRI